MNMIRRLHRQFIAIATAAIVLIVAAALGIINGAIYFLVHDEIRTVISYIVNNGGTVSDSRRPSSDGWLSDGGWIDDTPEFAYQTRYFSVLFDQEGSAKVVNINQIAAFNAKEAMETAVEAAAHGRSEGFFKKGKASYAYTVADTQEGTMVVILDCTRDMAVINTILKYSALFGALCVAVFVLIVSVLSKRALRPFIRNMENQKRFITNAGHELKTPIAIISANTEALALISGQNEWTDNILKQVSRLSKLINDLITLAKVGEASPQDVVLTEVNLTSIVRSAADSFRPVVADAGKIMETDAEDDITARAEMRFFGELVNILLDNAVKYCDDGGLIHVSLTTRKNGKGAVLAVSNDYKEGGRIDYSRFFERFYRGDTSHNSAKAGYGIGLSMAEDLTKLMKGKISVRWEKGIITFQVELGA